jgi:hypothetical protein
VSDDEVANMTVADGAAGYVRIASELLAATFGGDAPGESAGRPFAREPAQP